MYFHQCHSLRLQPNTKPQAVASLFSWQRINASECDGREESARWKDKIKLVNLAAVPAGTSVGTLNRYVVMMMERRGDLTDPSCATQQLPASFHQWPMSMLSAAIQTVSSVLSRGLFFFKFTVCLPSHPQLCSACLTGRLSIFPTYSKLSCTRSILCPSPLRQTLRVSERE